MSGDTNKRTLLEAIASDGPTLWLQTADGSRLPAHRELLLFASQCAKSLPPSDTYECHRLQGHFTSTLVPSTSAATQELKYLSIARPMTPAATMRDGDDTWWGKPQAKTTKEVLSSYHPLKCKRKDNPVM